MINSTEYNNKNPPPPRPQKSNLRGVGTNKTIKKPANNIKKQGRFIEQFDQLPPQELLDFISDAKPTKQQRQRTISAPNIDRSLSFKKNKNTMTKLDESYFPSPSPIPTLKQSSSSLTRNLSTTSRRSITPTLSTPPQPRRSLSTNTISNKNNKNVYRRPPSSTIASTVARSTGTGKLVLSLNRASVIVIRLEQWLQLIKCLIQWLEETSKLHLQLSRGYANRHGSLFQMELQPDQTPAASTLYAGFRLITTSVADSHHKFGSTIQLNYIPTLLRFKKECKEKIKVLRNDPKLLLDELLRRAEQTKKSMDLLNKACQLADSSSQQHGKNDPWLANLYVLRQLKREVDEENRLRLLMVPIQKETAEFEKQLLEALKPIVQYCCEYLAPGVWDGSADEETAPFQLLMERIVPQHEWEHFYAKEEKELVDEENPRKDYLKILYPNKLHTKVVTLKKGNMDRYIGGIKVRFSERLYVLAQSGYLHQFSLDDKLVPERSIYIPGAHIQPIDDCTFEIQRLTSSSAPSTSSPSSGQLKHQQHLSTITPASAGSDVPSSPQHKQHHKKVYIVKAKNNEEMLSWCKILSEMATGKLPIIQPRLPNSSTNTTTNTTNTTQPFQLQFNEDIQPSAPSSCSSSINMIDKKSLSMNENKSRSSTTSSISSPPSSIAESHIDVLPSHSSSSFSSSSFLTNNGISTKQSIGSVSLDSLKEEEENDNIQRQTMIKMIDVNNSDNNDNIGSMKENDETTTHDHSTLQRIKPFLIEEEDIIESEKEIENLVIKKPAITDHSKISLQKDVQNDIRPLSPIDIISKEDTLGNLVKKFTTLKSNINDSTIVTATTTTTSSPLESIQQQSDMDHTTNIKYQDNYDDGDDKKKKRNEYKDIDMDEEDDDNFSVSSGESISTVTKRYSLLPTTSNQLENLNFDNNDTNNNNNNDQEGYDDDDGISLHSGSTFTQYDDAASHISSRLSFVSTDYDDAFSHISSRLSMVESQYDDTASSLYLSSMSTRSSTPTTGLSRSNSLSDFDHHINLPHLDGSHT
ncbi:hypothetical protein BJ944DRAFT_238921 [Cunninghamella echinulata]|nr:hypothetical protein BJ944DRAFT_238921 [Cunninghamella echinulata]